MKNKDTKEKAKPKKLIEASSVTTFAFRNQTIKYINEIIRYNNVSKQKLFEMIITDKLFLENIIKRNQKYH